MELMHKILKQNNILFHQNIGITIATVTTLHEGYTITKEILNAIVDRKTVLYLSGGSTPKELYKKIAEDEQLISGAVGMVDERFGSQFHEKSNEKMMQETGLLRYLHMRDVPFYPILQNKSREETAHKYDETFRSLNAMYQKSVAILGIGEDGHTAGIAGNRRDSRDKGFSNPLFEEARKLLYVSEFNDPDSSFKERVTMTFLGLSLLDVFVVLVFGDAKQHALAQVFTDGSEEEIPSRFFKRPDVAKKTLFITDQRI